MHVIDSLALGGAERMLVDIANQTSRDGYRVSVCATRSSGPLEAALDPAIDLTILGRRARFDVRPMLGFARLLRRAQPDVLHVHGRSSVSFTMCFTKIGGVDSRLLMHDHYPLGLNSDVPPWFSWVGRHAVDEYVGVYPAHAVWASKAGLPSRKVRVIDNAIDLSNLLTRPLSGRLGDPARICLVGRLTPQKGVDRVLEALASLRSQLSLEVRVVGPEPDPEHAAHCRRLARLLPEHIRVEFLGARQDVPVILADSDIAVHGARAESGPLVLAEYMAAGLPFVCTSIGSLAKRVEQAGIPGIVPPDSAAALAAALDEVLELDDPERLVRAEKARELARTEFDIAGVASKWYSIYRDIQQV